MFKMLVIVVLKEFFFLSMISGLLLEQIHFSLLDLFVKRVNRGHILRSKIEPSITVRIAGFVPYKSF